MLDNPNKCSCEKLYWRKRSYAAACFVHAFAGRTNIIAMAELDKKAVVYVFDDNEVIRMLIDMHLRQAGFEVHAFEDAVEGGKALLDTPPDLLICDIDMPFMNGLEFLGTLNADSSVRKVPTIVLTARTDADTETAASIAGADCFLTKPVQRENLLRMVNDVLSRGRARHRPVD